jgi:hypothetical protein
MIAAEQLVGELAGADPLARDRSRRRIERKHLVTSTQSCE